MASELNSVLEDFLEWGRKWLVDFSAGKAQLVLFDWSNNSGAIDVRMDESVLDKKFSFKMLRLPFFSKLDWGSYIIFIAETVLVRSMKFLSPEVYLCLHKSNIWPCMEYCCHVWAFAPSCNLELLDRSCKNM